MAFVCIAMCYDSVPRASAFTTNAFRLDRRSSALSSPRERKAIVTCVSSSAGDNNDGDKRPQQPSTFREAEILGLRLMQESMYQEALDVFEKALTLPGTKVDVIRTRNVPGPSPVGGSAGGTEGKEVRTLDEFEKQAAFYNMACACANLGKIEEAVNYLRKSIDNGFDNVGTINSDPDLRVVRESESFRRFMDTVDPPNKRGGFFGLFK